MVAQREIIFDISRLLTRFSRPVPNGIDRVDFGYAQHFLDRARGGRGAIVAPRGPRLVANPAAQALVTAMADHWRETSDADRDPVFHHLKFLLCNRDGALLPPAEKRKLLREALSALRGLSRQHILWGPDGILPGRNLMAEAPPGAIYLHVSQFPLWIDRCFRWLGSRPDIKAVFFIHDLLPLRYPEFFPPGEAVRHQGRLAVMARYASGVIVASEHTKALLLEHVEKTLGRASLPILVNPLPVSKHFQQTLAPDPDLRDRPYFVSVGTMEPRKNQLLLLQIWRELAQTLGPTTPALILVGQRGWENENILDILDRSPHVQRHVIEVNGLSTPAVRRLMASAAAVLMPSFAEGFGLPVAEALAAGVNVLASDIVCFRSIKSRRLELLDPTDGPSWQKAIMRSIKGNGPNFRQTETEDCADFPDWACHLRHVENFISGI